MKNTLMLMILLASIVFISCDPQTCKFCEEVDFGYKEWSDSSGFILVDSLGAELIFDYVNVEFTKEGEQCDIGSSVRCINNTIVNYREDILDFDMELQFQHYPDTDSTGDEVSVLASIIIKYDDEEKYKFWSGYIQGNVGPQDSVIIGLNTYYNATTVFADVNEIKKLTNKRHVFDEFTIVEHMGIVHLKHVNGRNFVLKK